MGCRTIMVLVATAYLLTGEADSATGKTRHDPVDVPGLFSLMARVTERSESFIEVRTINLLTKPLQLRGTLVYRRPDYIEKRIDAPYRERIVIEGDALTITGNEKSRHLHVDEHPLLRSYVEAIRAVLVGDVSTLRRYYHIKIGGTMASWTLTLRPLDPQAAEYLTAVTISGQGDRVRTVDILETSGDRSVMEIKESRS